MKNRIAVLGIVLGVLALGVLLGRHTQTTAAEKESAFASSTIDLGVVVSDLDKSAKFYTDVVGFKEVKGFSVGGEFCADAGLTDSKPLKIRVFVLDDGKTATKLKLMTVAGAKKNDNQYVNSELGFRYLTIFVNDTNAALARLKNADVKPLAKSPVAVPKDVAEGIFLTVVRDPDGNLVELVGPKK
jgi:catechol 2,3-dioxygenase-like lactoylglutathione lyase family enzyme